MFLPFDPRISLWTEVTSGRLRWPNETSVLIRIHFYSLMVPIGGLINDSSLHGLTYNNLDLGQNLLRLLRLIFSFAPPRALFSFTARHFQMFFFIRRGGCGFNGSTGMEWKRFVSDRRAFLCVANCLGSYRALSNEWPTLFLFYLLDQEPKRPRLRPPLMTAAPILPCSRDRPRL